MKWLSRLSLAQAVRWALLWPALLLSLAVIGILLIMQGRDELGIWIDFHPVGPLPAWLAILLAVSLFLLGPSCLFLLLWRAASRWGR